MTAGLTRVVELSEPDRLLLLKLLDECWQHRDSTRRFLIDEDAYLVLQVQRRIEQLQEALK